MKFLVLILTIASINLEGAHMNAIPNLNPEIISDQWGEIVLHLNGKNKKFKDAVILPADLNGKQLAEEWNWKWEKEGSGMSHNPGIRMKDIEHYILSRKDILKPDVIILSQGRGHGGKRDNNGPGILKVEEDVPAKLKEKGFEVHILKTLPAIEKYNELIRQGKKVAALIHTTC